MSLLAIDGLTKQFAGLAAVKDVGFQVNAGELVGLIGPNGAGKTTLLSLVSGALPPTSGEIRFRGEPITHRSMQDIARRGAVRTYQRTNVFIDSTVLDNVSIGCHLRTSIGFWSTLFNLQALDREEASIEEAAREIIEFVGLAGKEDVLARHLSYGDQRRLGIGIALGARPELLMLDEPAAGMNPEEIGRLMALVRRIHARGVTIVLVEHNMRMVMSLCDRIIVLDHGSVIAEGTPSEIGRHPDVIRVYLGRASDDARH